MPPSKQQSLSVNNSDRTLHNFFSAKPVHTRRPQKRGSKSTQTTLSPEVIIIDSDSDNAPEILEVTSSFHKRRKLSSKNSNELVISQADGISLNGPKLIHSNDNSIPLNQGVEGEHSRIQTIVFGRPFLLFPSLEDKRLDEGDKAKGNERFEDAFTTHETFNSSASALSCHEVDIDLTSDCWDNGDDEIASNSVANNVLNNDAFLLQDEWETVSENTNYFL